ncbi:hypothetical protein CEE37_09720 [candidate division LCP-89 bacterium B3_LCP]|uniref:Fibronectin type-III domain-containing protein n=1 Tax=candidate division LCP-89 bacterium B3_LCP TaxID=2012998 RepID=A0A532UYG6_UNCL8|nr:MAG: hypothetical protein CEE37_09720 [candidate division LCP-89 bacterium B3_LCP]
MKADRFFSYFILATVILVISCATKTPVEPEIINNPPGAPSNPTPYDGLANVSMFPVLSWTAVDPDGDSLIYDVYLGDANPPPLVVENVGSALYSPLSLSPNTIYYWKVDAKDGTGEVTEGPTWTFATSSISGVQISSFGSLPRWSPDGDKVLFGGQGVNVGLWVYYRLSGNTEQITDDTHPHRWDYKWSPQSDQIAFGGAGPTSTIQAGIFTVALDGSQPVWWHSTGHSPCWIPDGTGIVFAEEDNQSATYGLFQLNFVDTSLVQLTGSGIESQFNSTGTRIAFRNPGSSQAYDLKSVSASGGLEITLADNCLHFKWTSDGTTLVYDYMSYSMGMTICSVSASGGVPVTLLTGAAEPSLSSTGILAFHGMSGTESLGVYTVSLYGGIATNRSANGSQPDISPDGSLLVYSFNDSIWLVYL